jgi:hypothetical protein
MNENDPIDGLLRQFLQSEEGQVDAGALAEGVRRRRLRRRVVRLGAALSAAAALVLIVAGVLLHGGTPPASPPARSAAMMVALPGLDNAAQAELVAAVRSEVEAALRGARSSGQAVLSAGAVPLVEVAQANRYLPDVVDRVGGAVESFLESTQPGPNQTQKEDPQWQL